MPPEEIIHSETLKPPFWLLAFIFFLLGSVALSIWAAFDNRSGVIALILAVVALPLISRAMFMEISVTPTQLHVGRAHIERRYLGSIQNLNIDQMRLTRGRDADPAAFLAIRFWQPRGVKIKVLDVRDSTPYWLISSKNPAGLIAALQKKRDV